MAKTCTTIAARKAKGRKLQQQTRDLILEVFKGELEQDDVRSTGMGQSGVDLQMSPLAQKLFPFAVENKAQEALSIFAALEQAEANATEKLKALVVFKKNRSKTYAALEFSELLKLIKELYELRKQVKELKNDF